MSIERNTRRAETAKELDRETWAGLDKIDYHFLVKGGPSGVGEAIAGPFWFGRAFDAPPFFSFSAVARSSSTANQLTIGVSEWLQDEQGMYVGAMLWITMNACVVPFPTGVVINETFETLIQRQGAGPKTHYYPDYLGLDGRNQLISHGLLRGPTIDTEEFGPLTPGALNRRGWGWSSVQDGIYATLPNEDNQGIVGWKTIKQTRHWEPTDNPREWVRVQDGLGSSHPWYIFNPEFPSMNEYEGRIVPDGPGAGTYFSRTNWHVETANPSTGTRHLRSWQPAFNLNAGHFLAAGRPLLAWGNTFACSYPYFRYNWWDGVAAEGLDGGPERPAWRVEPGMRVRLSFDAFLSKYDTNNEDGPFHDAINVFFSIFDKDMKPLGGPDPGEGKGWDPSPVAGPTLFTPFDLESAEGTYVKFDTDEFWANDPHTPGEPTIVHPDAHWMLANFAWEAGNTFDVGSYPEKHLDIDNFKFEIIGDAQPSGLPLFDVALNFEGRLLKNYIGVHPIDEYSHPTEVVLS